jgi:light-regulated signal transduction histidine kinase (bacteriophytochrome)
MSVTESRVFPVNSLVSVDSVPISLLRRRAERKESAPTPISSSTTLRTLRSDKGSKGIHDCAGFHSQVSADANKPQDGCRTALAIPTGVPSARPKVARMNSIRGFGAAIGLEENSNGSFRVSMTSDNSKAMFGYSSSELFALGDFADILDENESDVLSHHIASAHAHPQSSTPEIFDLSIRSPDGQTNQFSCAVHTDAESPSSLFCEFEPQNLACPACNCPHKSNRVRSRRTSCTRSSYFPPVCRRNHGLRDAVDTLSTMSKANEKMATAPTTEALLERLVHSVKNITQHQDVAVHCFDKQWNGRVIARSDDKQTFNYSPKPDEVSFNLPQEFKEILENHKVQVQLGADQNPSYLVGRPDEAPPSVESVLLRVLPDLPDLPMLVSDQETLQSRVMVPLQVSGKLWGVLICHQSQSSKPISFLSRGVCRLIADSATTRLEALSNSQVLEARGPFSHSSNVGNKSALPFPAPRDMLSTLKANFAISVINDTKTLMGTTIASQEGFALMEYLRARKLTVNLMSTDLTVDFPDLHYKPGLRHVKGILFIPLSPDGEDFVVFFQEATSASSDQHIKTWTESDIQNAAVLRVVSWKLGSISKEKDSALQENRLCRLLVSNSSHEFRTLLNAITNYLEFAQDGQLDAKTNEAVESAKNTSRLLLEAVTKLLGHIEKELEPRGLL